MLSRHFYVLTRLAATICNHLIAAVKDIGDRVGITVARYDFSEPQQRKVVCDRVLCPMKAAIRKHITRKAMTS